MTPDVLDAAARLAPDTLRSRDAIHLVSALALGDDLDSWYLGDLAVNDEHKVGAIEGVLLEAVADAGLAEQARNNTKVDFSNSPALQVVLEDAIWSHETASAEVLAATRALPPGKLVQLALDFGLYERLRERSAG